MGTNTNPDHARLSPSAAKRWINCPASVCLCDGLPEESSKYAEEGTLAHAYCAKGLKERLGWSTEAEDKEIALLGPKYDSEEMPGYVAWYVDHVWAEYQRELAEGPADLLVEAKLDMSEWVPECFGTADAIVVSNRKLLVCDYKYGKGVPVSATRNPQLAIYALGAIALLGWQWSFETVEMAICQPRVNMPKPSPWLDEMEHWAKKWREDPACIVPWGETFLKGAAVNAWNSHPDMARKPGEWCRFCKARKAGLCSEGDNKFSRPDDGSLDWLELVAIPQPTIEYKYSFL